MTASVRPAWAPLLALALALTWLTGCEKQTSNESPAQPSGTLTILSHTAGDEGARVSSHLIAGEKAAILVDSQFTSAEAQEVVEMIRASGKTLQSVFITHGHPDHHFGAAVIREAFPDAPIQATQQVVEWLKGHQPHMIEGVRKRMGGAIPADILMPEAFEGDALELEGHQIRIQRLGPGESPAAALLYIPALKALIAGDLVFHNVHLWLAGGELNGWVQQLHAASQLGEIETVYPGHGEPGGKDLLPRTDGYIRMFAMVTDRSPTPEVALQEMQLMFPDHAVPFYLQRAVQARFEKKAEQQAKQGN